MPDSDLLSSLLFKINEHPLALEAAIMELTNRVEQPGAANDRMRIHQDDTRGDDDAGVTVSKFVYEPNLHLLERAQPIAWDRESDKPILTD
jgi:hypothetical protein